ncbi:fatty acyl-AMP ligase [Streptomyces sp. 549]|uniref:fatty acyl-AMP ligase n=1 Tax=Streptomyces sp. 549 TaxID=3049076 RepID=UPI0024C25565|nr:fatty acyl-AMP ligase [Streptomyces sp. 549]MDK1474722.1 fatty acyl-AMP ligase [Streptomyces sp. 549]
MPASPLPEPAPEPSPAPAPAPADTLPTLLAHWTRHTPDRRAFTFVEYPLPDSRGVHRTLTWARLGVRTRAVAAHLSGLARPYERVALLCPQGPGFVVGFLAALQAGTVAVPMFTPDLPGHADRLAAVLTDARPTVVLTTESAASSVRAFLAEHRLEPHLVVVERVPDERGDGWVPSDPGPQATAYLQYTSGSTRLPAGVEITHGNVVANACQALGAYGAAARPVTTVGWLPLYHDMGLVLSVAAPVVRGLHSVLMDPAAFLQRPVRWLQLLSAHRDTISAAPNFAYDYCASAVADHEKTGLRLDRVTALINGSEPVRPATADRFHAAFAQHGLRDTVHCPSYGLAEATVFVSAHRPGTPPQRYALDREGLAAGKALPAAPGDPDAVLLAACGEPAGQAVSIVDPGTGAALAEGEVGEILVQGPNVGRGYWGREQETRDTFRNAWGDAPGPWLRTGDLGTILDGRLLVTGRLKDLIIVDGRNHYPQELEATAEAAHPAVRPGRLVAFAVSGADGGESAVVVAEHVRGLPPEKRDSVQTARAVRAAVSARHALRLSAVLLVPPGSVPRTSSGKVSRALARQRYLDGAYDPGPDLAREHTADGDAAAGADASAGADAGARARTGGDEGGRA